LVWALLVVLTQVAALVVLGGAVMTLAWPLAPWVLSVMRVMPVRVCPAKPALGTAEPARQSSQVP